MLALGLASCSKSNEALIEDYRDLCTEVQEAVKDGDMSKIISLSEKAEKLSEELSKRDLTDEQKAEMLRISTELMRNSASDIMNNAQDFSKDLENLFK